MAQLLRIVIPVVAALLISISISQFVAVAIPFVVALVISLAKISDELHRCEAPPTEGARISVTLGSELISYSGDGVNHIMTPRRDMFLYLVAYSRSWMPFARPQTIHPMMISVYLI